MFKSKLDSGFKPIEKFFREYETLAKNGERFSMSVMRGEGEYFTVDTKIIDSTGIDTVKYIENYLRTLLYVVGGCTVYVAGNEQLIEIIKRDFSLNGKYSFDVDFSVKTFDKAFDIIVTDFDNIPPTTIKEITVNNSTAGNRIGLDLGGSDKKITVMKDGELLLSKEDLWLPKLNEDISYHYNKLKETLFEAKSLLGTVDSVGISTAGVVVENKLKICSLFVKVDSKVFKEKGSTLLLDVVHEVCGNIPVKIINDGDVTALAGASTMNSDSILGIAMGTSEAGGYVNENGNLNGWLNELAFVPVDVSDTAPVDEWCGVQGVGAKYFSQDAVIRLADKYGFETNGTLAEKLVQIQKFTANDGDALNEIYGTIGLYLGYEIAFYSRFYNIKKVMILGRVTSGKGAEIIIDVANGVLKEEYPNLFDTVEIVTPNEQFKRLGQSEMALKI